MIGDRRVEPPDQRHALQVPRPWHPAPAHVLPLRGTAAVVADLAVVLAVGGDAGSVVHNVVAPCVPNAAIGGFALFAAEARLDRVLVAEHQIDPREDMMLLLAQ